MTDIDSNSGFIQIAVIKGPHGLNGRLRILLLTNIEERFNAGSEVFLLIGGEYLKYKVTEFNYQNKGDCRLSLSGINDRNDAENLNGTKIFIEKSQAEATRHLLPEDSYYYYDLVGCTVIRENENFGIVKDILEAGGGSLLLIEHKEREYMIPFVESMVDVRGIKDRIIFINPVEGLFDI